MPVREPYDPPYGDLTELNTNRSILDSVGEERLAEIVEFFQELLDTSTAIYEKNGDYALGIFTSSWCRLMDSASRKLCDTDDDKEALESGEWLCHESCWTEASKQSILQEKVVDIECNGGIHMYAVPIFANGEPIGSINLGYGDPPQDKETLMEISEKYNLPYDLLIEKSQEYESRPEYIISAAKKRIALSAKLIGEIVERRQTEASLLESNNRLKGFMKSATDGFMIMDKELRVIDANQNWLERANVTENVFGTRIDELFPVLRENGRYDAYLRVINTGEPVEFGTVKAPSGTGFVYNIKAFKVGEGVGLIVRNITEQVKQEEHIEYLYEILLAIRNVNQLIVTEKDRKKLLKKSCELMVETKGYNHCRIIHLDKQRNINIYDTSPDLQVTIDNIDECPCTSLLSNKEVTVIKKPEETCNDCPFYSGATGYAVLAMALNHHGNEYGYITSAVPLEMIGEDELALFKEVTEDLGYALYSLDNMEEKEAAVIKLERFQEKMENLHFHSSQLQTAETINEIIDIVSNALENTLGYPVRDIIQVKDGMLIDVTTTTPSPFSLNLDEGGITSRAARLGETQLVTDTRLDENYIQGTYESQMLSEIVVPIIVEDSVEYLLNIEHPETNAFTENDVRVLETLGMHMSLAIGHIRDNNQKIVFAERLESLHQYSVNSIESQSLEELSDLTIQALQEIMEFEFSDVSIVQENKIVILKSTRQGKIKELSLDGPGIVVRTANTGESQYVPDIRLDPDYVTGEKTDEKGDFYEILSELSVPVKVAGEVRLVLNIERNQLDAFTRQDQKLVEILATHMASAYELIQERIKRATYTFKLESLYKVTESLPTSESLDKIAEKIQLAVREIIGYELGSFGLVKDNVLHHEYIWGVTLDEEFILPLNGTGVTVRAVRSGESQLVKDTSLEPEFATSEKAGKIRSELCVPIKIAGEVVAVINVESRSVNAFSEEDNSLLSILAEHIGSTMHNLQLLENEREFTKHLEALSTSMASLNTSETIEEIAKDTIAIIDEIMEVPYTSFSIISENELVAIKCKGAPLIDLNLPLNGKGITVRAVKENKTVLVNDTRADPDYVMGSTDSLSELAIPIKIDGAPIGVINMESLELDYFDSTHQSLAETLAVNVASNIQRIQREEATRAAERRIIREQERADQAVELEEMKTNFIRTATHEIRTPLTSIKGYTQLAQKKIEENNPVLERYFEVILRNTERLEALSADLLDIQRIESGKIELNIESVYIHEIIDNVILELKPILDSRNQNLIVEGEDSLIKADRIRMMQVIVNLAMNASKYSPEGSDIKIIIEKDDLKLQVSVIDEGVGIKKEDMPKLFKPFPGIRVRGVKDSTGLGLSICKGLIELHGGKIWAESDGPGQGSRFTFSCPCKIDE